MKEKLLFDWKQKYERIQWELKDNEQKYVEELMQLVTLKRKIESASEQNLESIQGELEQIVIYERVGRARESLK